MNKSHHLLVALFCAPLITWAQQDAPVESAEVTPAAEVYDIAAVQEQPQFPGGQDAMMKYISENFRYPKEAVETGMQGRIYLQFVVRRDGTVSDVEVLRSVASSLDSEAVRVVQGMPKWTPASVGSRTVDCRMVLPISCVLPR